MGSETASTTGGLLESLGKRLYCRLKPSYTRLATALALLLARRDKVHIIADDALAYRIASTASVAEQAVLVPCSRAASVVGRVVLLWCKSPSPVAEVVFASGSIGKDVERRLKTLYARMLTPSLYLLRGCGREELVEVREDYSLGPPRLSAEEEKVLSVLCMYIADWGTLSVREAAELIAHELGVGRGIARSLIVKASRKGFVVIEEGHVARLRVCPRRL